MSGPFDMVMGMDIDLIEIHWYQCQTFDIYMAIRADGDVIMKAQK